MNNIKINRRKNNVRFIEVTFKDVIFSNLISQEDKESIIEKFTDELFNSFDIYVEAPNSLLNGDQREKDAPAPKYIRVGTVIKYDKETGKITLSVPEYHCGKLCLAGVIDQSTKENLETASIHAKTYKTKHGVKLSRFIISTKEQ